MSAYRHPAPEASLADAQAAYIGAEKLAKKAQADYLDAKRATRAVWAPRIFAALVGLGAAVGISAFIPSLMAWALAPSPCRDSAWDIEVVGAVSCIHPDARLVQDGKVARCLCPRVTVPDVWSPP